MVVVRRLAVADLDDAAKWKLLHETTADIVAFRNGDHSAERLKLERERIAQKDQEIKIARQKTVEAIKKAASDPAIQGILAGDGNNDEITNALGRAMFGELWEDI
jgi:hypothetical protein